jgi:hypothetical protein
VSKRCAWPVGTVYTGPKSCGKPAREHVTQVGRPDLYVCGSHLRSAVRWGYRIALSDDTASHFPTRKVDTPSD